jgi:hypothetical protein
MCCAFVFLRFVFPMFQFLWIVPVLIASSVFSDVFLVFYVSRVALFIHIVTLFCTARSRRFHMFLCCRCVYHCLYHIQVFAC